MRKTLTALQALGNMKMQVLAAAGLFAMVCNAYGQDEPRYKMEDDGERMVVFGDCTLTEIATWASEEMAKTGSITSIDIEGIEHSLTVTVDEVVTLPAVGIMEFIGNCNLVFDSLATLQGGIPMIYVGKMWTPVESHLTITFSDTAIKEALTNRDVKEKIEMPILVNSMFSRDAEYAESTVSFTFGDAEYNETYTYINEDVTQEYKNVGIISPGSLAPNTAALLFVGGEWKPEQAFATGTFTVAFVGSSYDPVPEPATGTLSLLALAGLAARRRRK